jgi:chromosome partitioning protein
MVYTVYMVSAAVWAGGGGGSLRTITVVNQKGGVGKSTTASAIGSWLSISGRRVLFVDLDPQGNLTYTLDPDRAAPNVADALYGNLPLGRVLSRPRSGGGLAGSAKSLSLADRTMSGRGSDSRLRNALRDVAGDYDYAVVDTPPTLGILTVNALVACDWAVVPAQADIFSLNGVTDLAGTVRAVRESRNPSLQVRGILLTRFNGRSVLGRDVAVMLGRAAAGLGTGLFGTPIRECTALREAQAMRSSIFEYAPASNGAKDYDSVMREMMEES